MVAWTLGWLTGVPAQLHCSVLLYRFLGLIHHPLPLSLPSKTATALADEVRLDRDMSRWVLFAFVIVHANSLFSPHGLCALLPVHRTATQAS